MSLSPSAQELQQNRWVQFSFILCFVNMFLQALAKGSDIPSVGTVQITWHTSQHSNANSQAPTVSSSQSAHADKIADELPSSSRPRHIPPSPQPQEEEVVASGWGDGDEDGMGF